MDSLKRGRPQPEALQSLEKYISASLFYQDEVIKISTRVEADVDNTKRDVSVIPYALFQVTKSDRSYHFLALVGS